ncbi:hypothetical protein [Apilactobacillus quenuiae]|uniref:hypothetical protein n=1 Tax=Apilactobacillus quenuiae TaxID=2008377 RepID=UPI000D01217C|nr:hypothetical protein [Apilactobacillus quenuiae]
MNKKIKHIMYFILQVFIIINLWFIFPYWWGQIILAFLSATTFSGLILIIIEILDYINNI